jgi:hypothetical protein
MKIRIAAVAAVALSALASTAWCGTSWAAESGTLRAADGARPGACGEAITRAETALVQSRIAGQPVASAPESVGAMLHHQPTRQSVARAESESEKNLEASIAQARKLRAQGRRSECIATLEKAAAPLGLR